MLGCVLRYTLALLDCSVESHCAAQRSWNRCTCFVGLLCRVVPKGVLALLDYFVESHCAAQRSWNRCTCFVGLLCRVAPKGVLALLDYFVEMNTRISSKFHFVEL